MKFYSTIFLIVLLSGARCYAQSPFDYGQNKDVYFISTQQRQQWGIDTIFLAQKEIDNHQDSTTWVFAVYIFDTAHPINNWSYQRLKSNWSIHFPTLRAKLLTIDKGDGLVFRNGHLAQNASSAPGAHIDYYGEYTAPDTVSYGVSVMPSIHQNRPPCMLTKNTFDKQGRLISYTYYDEFKLSQIDSMYRRDSTALFSYYRDSSLAARVRHAALEGKTKNTFYYSYDKDGRYLFRALNRDTIDQKKLASLFELRLYSDVMIDDVGETNLNDETHLYIGEIPMEKYLQQKIGYLPNLVLFEMYKYGVTSYVLNQNDHRYRNEERIILEK